MDPNTLMNIGADPSVWFFVGLFLIMAYVVGRVLKRIEKKSGVELPFTFRPWHVVAIVAIGCTIWVLFTGYGAGEAEAIPSVSSDGVQSLIKSAPRMPTEEELERSAEERKPEPLKELESNLAEDNSEDDYIKRAIERVHQKEDDK